MSAETVIKEYWPWFLGGGIGLYILFHYSSGTTGNAQNANAGSASYLAAMAQIAQQNAQLQAQQQAQQMAYNEQMAQLQAQVNLAQEKLQVQGVSQYNNSLANMANGFGSGLSQVIQAQSYIPAMAINSASAENQSALSSAAQVASSSMLASAAGIGQAGTALAKIDQSYPAMITASGQAYSNVIHSTGDLMSANAQLFTAGSKAVNRPLATLGATLSGMANSYQNLGGSIIGQNAQTIGMTAGSNAQMASNVAQSNAQANAQSSGNMWGTLGLLGTSLIGAFA